MASKLTIRELESDTGILKLGGTSKLDLSDNTDFLDISAGTTDQRGTPAEGAIRWNYDYDSLEYYNGSRWVRIQKPKVIDNIVKAGLMIHLDPEDEKSYNGIDNRWYDLTRNHYDFTLTGNYRFEIHRGAKCFNFDGGYSDFNCFITLGIIRYR